MSDVFDPLRKLAAITDPADRAAALNTALAALPDINAELRAARQAAVQELRATRGMSHADVAALLGISRGRAQQIAEGRTTGKRADSD